MAELFSLMPESTSCENDRVEASRTLLRSALPTMLHVDAFAAGEIPRDPCSARQSARRAAGSRLALGMTRDLRLVSFRARAGNVYRVMLATGRGGDREESRPGCLHTLSMDRAKPSFPVAADGLSAIGESRCWPRQKVQKSMTKKAAERNPSSQKWQRLQGVYFLSH